MLDRFYRALEYKLAKIEGAIESRDGEDIIKEDRAARNII